MTCPCCAAATDPHRGLVGAFFAGAMAHEEKTPLADALCEAHATQLRALVLEVVEATVKLRTATPSADQPDSREK